MIGLAGDRADGDSRKLKGESRGSHGLGAAGPEGRSREMLEMGEKRGSFVQALMRGRIAPWGAGQRWKRLMEREL